MNKRFKERIIVSAEVKTYLKDLYNQIEYELREDYEDSLEKTTNILTELEEWLKEQGNNGIDEWGNHYTICLYKLNKLKEKYK